MLNVQTIAEYLKDLHNSREQGVAVYWIEESSSRTELISGISIATSGLPILIVSVPKGSFADPNGIIDDLAKTIFDHEEWFKSDKRTAIIQEQKFTLVLISKRPLGVPQISSPVTLPDWFPLWANKLLTVNITSVTHTIDISMASPEIPSNEMNTALYSLELALSSRLLAVGSLNHSLVSKLISRFSTKGPSNLLTHINDTQTARTAVAPPDFRPGGAIGSIFVVSHLFRLWWECSPNELHALSLDLASALDIHSNTSIKTPYSLATLLTRTAIPPLAKTPLGVTFSRNIFVSLSNVIQFSNAGHHAADYPNFPALLTVSFARDLIRSCEDSASTLKALI